MSESNLKWTPEDWEHTFVHLQRAERMLLLRRIAWVASTVCGAAIAAFVFIGDSEDQVDHASNKETPVEEVAHLEKPATPEQPESKGSSATTSIAFAEVVEKDGPCDANERTDSEKTIPSDLRVSEAAQQPQFDKGSNSASQENSSETLFIPGNSRAVDAKFSNSTDHLLSLTRRSETLQLLCRINAEFEQSTQPRVLQNDTYITWPIPAANSHVPLRFFFDVNHRGLAVEAPFTVAQTGRMLWEVYPGLSFETATKNWSAWHPGSTPSSPMRLKRVATDFAIQSHLGVAGMTSLNYTLKIGAVLQLEYDWARRMDYGEWNPEAEDWNVLELENSWGRVTESSPFAFNWGARVDWAIAPDWTIVSILGVEHRFTQALSAAQITEEHSPFWLQIGIVR
jgi:hypothetical protein